MRAHSYLIAMLLLLATGAAHAQDTLYWTGAVSTEWGNPGNWTGPSAVPVPGPSVTVVIDPPTYQGTVLETDYGIAELIIRQGTVSAKYGSLAVSGDVTITGGDLGDDIGRPVTVGGSVHVYGGKIYVSDTLTVGGDFIEEAPTPLSTITALRLTGNALLKPQTVLGALIIDGGALVTLGSGLTVSGTLRNDGTIFLNGSPLFIASADPSAVSGTGGVVDTLRYSGAQGSMVWGIGTGTGTYAYPFRHSLGGQLAPLDIDVTAAGTGSGRIVVTSIGLDGAVFPLVASQLGIFRDADGGGNAAYNASHLWNMQVQDYSSNPVVAYTFRYDDTDIDGTPIDESRLQAQCFENTACSLRASGTPPLA